MILVRDKKNFELGGEKTVNDKWMEAGFMLIQQVAHLAKYQTLKEMRIKTKSGRNIGCVAK